MQDQPVANDGPYLAMALFCERVLKEEDGTLSFIRVVDRVTVSAQGSQVPDALPTIGLALQMVIGLKAGRARGRGTLLVCHEAPSGLQKDIAAVPVLFEGEDRGVNLHVELNFQVNQEGLHWFPVRLDGRLITRIPLRVFYAPQPHLQLSGGAPPSPPSLPPMP
jgi:hypothetical protein